MYKRIYELMEQNREMVVATIVDALGSTPGRRSFRMIVMADGTCEGTVGGGALEHTVCQRSLECVKKGCNYFENLDLEKIGMSCGGEVKVFYEYIARQMQFYIFGGGHIARAITPMASSLGYSVTVVDNRKEVAVPSLHPHAAKVLSGSYDEVIRALEPSSPASALIVSHGHAHDQQILKEILQKDFLFDYVGMIGSRKKVTGIIEHMRNAGISDEKIGRVYSPVGIDIGADTPDEIAISILAEMIALRRNRQVPHMRIAGRKDA